MMAQAVPNPPNDKKRVKVYELRNNDWFDRGTGFCTARVIFNDETQQDEPKVLVESEDHPNRMLLETKICEKDSFQKQQETLIVWTEPLNGIDMALSFQEAEGCSAIWKFVNSIQVAWYAPPNGHDDSLSDDIAVDPFHNPITVPIPTLGNIAEVEAQIRGLSNTQSGRDALTKFVVSDDYIRRLIPLVEMAEDMEDLLSLHRLCNIMKALILLNDTMIIEHAVTDDIVLGVVGALEYDPDFPSHKANHRLWLGREGRFREVVRFQDETIQKKIHHTYRLQYLKDVVLARILDDPTFSVLNSLIFFNQVDIVTHLQSNGQFLKELFGIFLPTETDQERKKEAVLFIQQCCSIAKNLQQPGRQALYGNFLAHGLLAVINFALRHTDVAVRVAATDVLVALIDHDPQMIRQTIYRQVNDKQPALTDSLIDLLLVEADLGVKSQVADAIKVLLDPGTTQVPVDNQGKANGEFVPRLRPQVDPQQELVLSNFYDEPAKKLFKPLIDLNGQKDMEFSVHQVSLFIYLIEILSFFIRQHTHRSKYFVLSENLGQRIAQLLSSPEKYLKLNALKFFRNLIGLQDEFYNQQMMADGLFEPLLDIVIDTMPRDNLLNSACLELFEFIKRENKYPLISHLAENYRHKLLKITYVDMFALMLLRYDQAQGFGSGTENASFDTEIAASPKRPEGTRGSRWGGMIRELDAAEEEYYNTPYEDEDASASTSPQVSVNGTDLASKPLVDYPSDDENEVMETDKAADAGVASDTKDAPETAPSPPERLSEKRRREEDEEDEIGKLSHSKRRNSGSSTGSASSGVLKHKKSFSNASNGTGGRPNKISINLSTAIKTGVEGSGGGENGA